MGITPSRTSKDSKSVSYIGRMIRNSLNTGMRRCDRDSLRIVETSVAVVEAENNRNLMDDTWDSGSSMATDADRDPGSWPVGKEILAGRQHNFWLNLSPILIARSTEEVVEDTVAIARVYP